MKSRQIEITIVDSGAFPSQAGLAGPQNELGIILAFASAYLTKINPHVYFVLFFPYIKKKSLNFHSNNNVKVNPDYGPNLRNAFQCYSTGLCFPCTPHMAELNF